MIVQAVLLAGVMGVLAVPVAAQSDEADRVREAARILEEIAGAPDAGLPSSVLERAEAIAVFPSTIKGAFLVGAQRGRGILSVRDPKTDRWSKPAFLTLTGGSIGFQVGGQATDVVLVVINRRGVDKLVRNSVKIGGDASVAAGPVGRDASAATDATFRAEILSYSRARGLFAGLSLSGATLRQDRDANERFYGTGYNTRQVVLEGRGTEPDAVAEWRGALAEHARRRTSVMPR
jgi:SH3 domain-containing YSC84-like protein 1